MIKYSLYYDIYTDYGYSFYAYDDSRVETLEQALRKNSTINDIIRDGFIHDNRRESKVFSFFASNDQEAVEKAKKIINEKRAQVKEEDETLKRDRERGCAYTPFSVSVSFGDLIKSETMKIPLPN